MGRFFNRFGCLALHALIWTLPFGLFPFEQPSDSQRIYFQVAVCSIAMFYFAGCIAAGTLRRPRGYVLWAAVLFALAAMVSSIASRSPAAVLKNTTFLWCGVLLAGMVAHLRLTRERCRGLLASLVGIATVCALIGVLQYCGVQFRWKAFGYSPNVLAGRFAVLSLLGHPNYLTAFIGPAFLVGVGLMAATPSRPMRIAFAMALLIIGLCIFVSGTRSAWLGILFAGSVTGFLVLRRMGRLHLTPPILIGAGAIAAVFLLFAVPNPLLPHRYSFVRRMTTGRSVAPRLYAYMAAVKMISANPLLGVGYNAYGVEFWDYSVALQQDPRNQVFGYVLEDMGGVRSDEAHNEYLQLAAELGVPGLGAFFLLLAVFFVGIRYDFLGAAVAADRFVLAGLAGAVLFVLIDSLFSFPLRLPCSSLAFWLILGVGSRYSFDETVKAPARARKLEPAAAAPPVVEDAFEPKPKPVLVLAGPPPRPASRRRRRR